MWNPIYLTTCMATVDSTKGRYEIQDRPQPCYTHVVSLDPPIDFERIARVDR